MRILRTECRGYLARVGTLRKLESWAGCCEVAPARSRVRRAALHATARIALGSSALGILLGGCGGKVGASGEPRGFQSGSGGATGGEESRTIGEASGGLRLAAAGGASGGGSSATGGTSGGESTVNGGANGGSEAIARGGASGGNESIASGGSTAVAEASGGREQVTGAAGEPNSVVGEGGAWVNGEAGAGRSGGGASGEGLVCVGPTVLALPSALPGPTLAEFECCVDFVASSVLDAGAGSVDVASSAAIANCCNAIIVAVDLSGQRYSAASPARSLCCSRGARPEVWQHSLCTPWGPPVPPALEWEAA